jgi:hypothetical protein
MPAEVFFQLLRSIEIKTLNYRGFFSGLIVCLRKPSTPGPGAGEEERVKGLVREVRELRGQADRAPGFSAARMGNTATRAAAGV